MGSLVCSITQSSLSGMVSRVCTMVMGLDRGENRLASEEVDDRSLKSVIRSPFCKEKRNTTNGIHPACMLLMFLICVHSGLCTVTTTVYVFTLACVYVHWCLLSMVLLYDK